MTSKPTGFNPYLNNYKATVLAAAIEGDKLVRAALPQFISLLGEPHKTVAQVIIDKMVDTVPLDRTVIEETARRRLDAANAAYNPLTCITPSQPLPGEAKTWVYTLGEFLFNKALDQWKQGFVMLSALKGFITIQTPDDNNRIPMPEKPIVANKVTSKADEDLEHESSIPREEWRVAKEEINQLNKLWPPTDVPVDQFINIMSQTLQPAFETENLLVFQIPIEVPETRYNRLMFVALPTFDPSPTRVAATLVLSFGLMQQGLEVACEWLEVMEDYRMQGIGIEFLIGVEKHTGWNIDLISSEPEFLLAFHRARLASKPPQPKKSAEAMLQPECESTKTKPTKPKAGKRKIRP